MTVANISWNGGFWTFLEAARLELLLFAGIWFVIGAIDELAVDIGWGWLRLTGRARTRRLDAPLPSRLRGPVALFVPAWREARVIGPMLRHALAAWPHERLRVYAGCYANDPETRAVIAAVASEDPRLAMIVHDALGPTTKGDLLNCLYRAMRRDEEGAAFRYRAVVLHDAEDMVHREALSLLDRGLEQADFVQLPVRPEPQPHSPFVAGHYLDEFTEAHARDMVLRDRLGTAMPAAGVGCAFARDALDRVATLRASDVPFAPDSLTEDYEMGLLIGGRGANRSGAAGGEARGGSFLRYRAPDGSLIATRAFFPDTLNAAVRQKSRWLQGIAFDGWDRLGWRGGMAEGWMRLRDRRGPLVALVLACAYLLVLVSAVLWLAELTGAWQPRPLPRLAVLIVSITAVAFVWRTLMRLAFTAGEYGLAEGLTAVVRIPCANIIAIIAARRALFGYIATLAGRERRWDKTEHDRHPAEREQDARA